MATSLVFHDDPFLALTRVKMQHYAGVSRLSVLRRALAKPWQLVPQFRKATTNLFDG
jgi:hypothetical protein